MSSVLEDVGSGIQSIFGLDFSKPKNVVTGSGVNTNLLNSEFADILKQRQQMQAQSDAAANRAAPTAATTANVSGPNTTRYDQTQSKVDQLNQMLLDTAQGRGPSVARDQLNQGLDKSAALANALAASARGNQNTGLLQRNISNQMADQMGQVNAEAAQIRSQEALNAQNQIGSLLANEQQSNLALSQQGLQSDLANQQTALQTNLANQQAALQQQQLNDNLVVQYMNAGLSLQDAQMRAKLDLEGMKSQEYITQLNNQNALDVQRLKNQQTQQNAFLGAALAGLSAGGVAGSQILGAK